MSDSAGGPDWVLGPDGKWYAPEQALSPPGSTPAPVPDAADWGGYAPPAAPQQTETPTATPVGVGGYGSAPYGGSQQPSYEAPQAPQPPPYGTPQAPPVGASQPPPYGGYDRGGFAAAPPPGYGAAPPYGGQGSGLPPYGSAPYGAPPYGSAPYGGPPGPYGYGQQKAGTNGLAIASLVLGIIWIFWLGSLLAIIFGAISLRQIKSSGNTQQGKGLAIAGLVLGLVGALTFTIVVIHSANMTTCVNGICRRR